MPRETALIDDQTLVLETGTIARQAAGSVVLRHGRSVLLATVVAAPEPAPGADFLPLTVEYQERLAASGRIPGNHGRREGRPSDAQILTCRLIDRTLRPLFAEGFACETQLQVTVFGAEPASDLESLALIAASAALHLSDLPCRGPVAGLRVVRADGVWRALPGPELRAAAELDLMIACTPEGLVMLEGQAAIQPEVVVLGAVEAAERFLAPLHEALARLRQAAGRPKRTSPAPLPGDPALAEALQEWAGDAIRAALANTDKQTLVKALAVAEREAHEALGPEGHSSLAVRRAFHELLRRLLREGALAGQRVAGRTPTELRPVSCELGILPTNHGSALFTRGQTQALVSATLGSEAEALQVDGLYGREAERFLLHYNFPNYAVNESRASRGGPGRREIGHGNLARRALLPVLPGPRDFPYTVRVVSDITESDGSSSMATICGATLALLDAGVPLSAPVAGVAMGLVFEHGQSQVLTDLCGLEDHAGDMDLKVAGTADGVTALQLDNKLGSLPPGILAAALEQARAARLELLAGLGAALPEGGHGLSPLAPQFVRLSVSPNRVGSIIGTGGKRIREIQSSTQTTIHVDGEGRVSILGRSAEDVERARARIEAVAADLRQDGLYVAVVTGLQEYGVFVRIGDHSGLVHISELNGGEAKEGGGLPPELAPGDELLVRLLGVDAKGRLRISQKAAGTATRSEALNAEWATE